MSTSLHNFAFGVYPYIAGTIFLLGSWVRFDREQYTWKTDSSQLLENKMLKIGSNIFHIGIIGIFLVTPWGCFYLTAGGNSLQLISSTNI